MNLAIDRHILAVVEFVEIFLVFFTSSSPAEGEEAVIGDIGSNGLAIIDSSNEGELCWHPRTKNWEMIEPYNWLNFFFMCLADLLIRYFLLQIMIWSVVRFLFTWTAASPTLATPSVDPWLESPGGYFQRRDISQSFLRSQRMKSVSDSYCAKSFQVTIQSHNGWIGITHTVLY